MVSYNTTLYIYDIYIIYKKRSDHPIHGKKEIQFLIKSKYQNKK